MKIGNVNLRLDAAHCKDKKSRSRYNSFNSTGNNNSNNHHHHHHHNSYNSSAGNNQHHHQHHHQSQPHHGNHQHRNDNKNLQSNSAPGPGGRIAALNSANQHKSQPHQHQHQHQHQQPQQQHQPSPPQTPPPAPTISQSSLNPASQMAPQQPLSANNTSSAVGGNLNLTSGIPNSHNLNSNQQAVAPDLRGHYPTAANIMNTHLLNTTEQPSMMTPTSLYGHLYPYAPPAFSYMPAQPNPVIPITNVPPVPPQQSPSTTGVNQHGGHSISSPNTNARYNSGGHHNQQHQPQSHAADTGGLGTMPGGVQGPHQGPPFYYYYPSPLYYDHQTGGAAPPPSIYHTQPFHPQFFAMPGPYMPNAQTYNQHQPQPPSASQSDATVITNQQQPQQQVMRTRDIDATIE